MSYADIRQEIEEWDRLFGMSWPCQGETPWYYARLFVGLDRAGIEETFGTEWDRIDTSRCSTHFRKRMHYALYSARRCAEAMLPVNGTESSAPTAAAPSLTRKLTHGSVALRRDAGPPDKFEALALAEPRVWRLLDRDPASASGDTSPSAFDLALANLCARAGWTAQEIGDLLYWNRLQRHQSHDEKIHDRQWYQRTADKAMNGRKG